MTNSTSNNVVPSEVGWQFVPQYYTFVNKQPNRLHCFYTKTSTFIHGTEGEETKPCYGQQEIHNKITSIGFQDCKVFIHSVDAQASANGGIIIQVIGEMSNHNEPWRKFVQTFFLAEQPNGYFVLNDIFRFLKEETVESDDGGDAVEPEPTAAPTVAEHAPAPASPAPVPAEHYEPAREPTPPPAVAAPSVPSTSAVLAPTTVDEAPTVDVPVPEPLAQVAAPAPTAEPAQPQPPAPAAQQQPNGIHAPEPEKATSAPVITEKSPTPAPQPPAPSPAAAASLPSSATPPAPQAQPSQPVAPAPAAAPTAPRSWASLAASNPRKWGSAVAQESRGVTETPASPAPPSGTQTPTSGRAAAPDASAGPAARDGPQQRHHHHQGPHPNYVAAQNLTTAQCFVKGVTENVSQTALTTALTQRFGPIKELDIVRAKACGFLEFTSVDAAKRAIIASLSLSQGGEGGIWIDVGADLPQARISIETKKERGERPVNRPRGGAPSTNGEGRGGGGSYRGRSGAGRGGRGGISGGGK